MKKFDKLLIFAFFLVFSTGINVLYSLADEVRYTENIIPVMSSDTSSVGKSSASSTYKNTDDNFEFFAWRAFDHSTSSSGWFTQKGTTTGWLAYEFIDNKCISKYTIEPRNLDANYHSIKEMPKNWTFEAFDVSSQNWVVLDTQRNILDWEVGKKKEFTFNNHSLYNIYRINISANGGYSYYTGIGEMELMEKVETDSTPNNLLTNTAFSKVTLSWDKVNNAQSYNIKRSKTSGGPYETIDTSSNNMYEDVSVLHDITYYYVVTAVLNGKEYSNSNEASAILKSSNSGLSKLKVVLEPEEKLQLSVDDHLDENKNMTWTSSDSTVAQVDSNGVVTAIKAGNAVVHAQSPDGNYYDDINILVLDNADDYRLAIDLKVGKTSRLTVDDLTNTLNVTWDSSDATVATVSSKGVVTAKGKGLTLTKVTDRDGNVVGQVYVRVRE